MSNVQLLLTGGKSLSDMDVCQADDGTIELRLGLAQVERFRNDPDSLQYKMAIGRLANLRYPIRALSRKFGHDRRTIKSWSIGVTVTDRARFERIFAGQGSLPKIPEAVKRLAGRRYQEMRTCERHFRKIIQKEVQAVFETSLSGEALRQIFREVDKAGVAGAPCASSPVPDNTSAPAPSDVPAVGTECVSTPESLDAPVAVTETVFAPELPGEAAAITEAMPVSSKVPAAVTEVVSAVAEPSAPPPPEVDSAPPPVTAILPVIPPLPPASESAQSSAVANDKSCATSGKTSTNSNASRNHSPSPQGLPLSGFRPPGGGRLCHHAGQILYALWVDMVTAAQTTEGPIHRQWLGQILQGAVNPEQTKNLTLLDLSCFTGGTSFVADTQRAKLAAQAAMDGVVVKWLRLANASIVPDIDGECFYLDPHTKEYTGFLKFLLGWCGRRHSVNKVLHLDCIHTESGWPVWISHFDNYLDLRERVFGVLDEFESIFPAKPGHPRTIIIDRGIFGLETFRRFVAHGTHLISWEKGHETGAWREGAPEEQCEIIRQRNDSKHTRTYRFRIQEAPWLRDSSIRRLVVLVIPPEGKPKEVSVLCTHPTMDRKKIVRLIFKRWLQENDFKNLDQHFGLMQMISRRSESYAEIAQSLTDQTVENPEFRALLDRKHELEKILQQALFKRERVVDDALRARATMKSDCREQAPLPAKLDEMMAEAKARPDPDLPLLSRIGKIAERMQTLTERIDNTLRGLSGRLARIKQLREEIRDHKKELEKNAERLQVVARDDSRLNQLIRGGYRRPDTGAKEIMDALRVIARNLFACLLREFRRHYDNLRDDGEILRNLTRAPGVARWHGDTIEIGLWPCGACEPAVAVTVDHFLSDITEQINQHFAGRALRVRIILLRHAPKL